MHAESWVVLFSVRMAQVSENEGRVWERRGLTYLEHGGGPLFGLRFADGTLVFAISSQQAAYLLDERVVTNAHVGLTVSEDKAKLLTTQAQPQKQLQLPED